MQQALITVDTSIVRNFNVINWSIRHFLYNYVCKLGSKKGIQKQIKDNLFPSEPNPKIENMQNLAALYSTPVHLVLDSGCKNMQNYTSEHPYTVHFYERLA